MEKIEKIIEALEYASNSNRLEDNIINEEEKEIIINEISKNKSNSKEFLDKVTKYVTTKEKLKKLEGVRNDKIR